MYFSQVLIVWKITKYNRIMALLSVFLILIMGSGLGAATEIIVHNGESIQVAVDNATPGDTVIVEPGTYNGNIVLNTENLVIMSQSGNPEDTVIQGDGFDLKSDAQGTVIKGFTLKGTDNSYGINLNDYADCTIEENKIENYNTAVSTSIYSTFTINNNEISSCDSGIDIGESYSATVKDNTISNCGTGVVVGDLGNANIENNMIKENDNGIALMYEARATVVGNTVNFNKKCGLYDNSYGGSTIYNNYFNNTVNVIFGSNHNYPNTWNTTKTAAANIISGPHIAGNYWAKPDGTGFSQTHYDADGDGIAEDEVVLNEKEIDHAAIVSSNIVTPEQPVETPNENQTGNQTEVPNENQTEAPNESQIGNQTEIPAQNLTELPVEGIEDTESSSSGGSHHSSGSSGGSTGGSPEPQKNVEAKDTARVFIPGEKLVYFNFTNNVTVVDYISFESEKTMGKTTAIVENLKNKSNLVTELPEGNVYKSFNVWVGNGGYGDSDDIRNAAISFKVEKAWIQENNINSSSIVLYKYDNKNKEWMKLPVNLTNEDDQSLHFTANVPGYSSFVITGEQSTLTTELTQTEADNKGSNNESNTSSETGAENPKSPGFGIIGVVVGLICAIRYKRT